MKKIIKLNNKKYTVNESTHNFCNLLYVSRGDIRELDLSDFEIDDSTTDDDFDLLNYIIKQCKRISSLKSTAYTFNLSINKLYSLRQIKKIIITDISKSFQIPEYLTNLETVQLSTNCDNNSLKIHFPQQLTKLVDIDVSDELEISYLDIPLSIQQQIVAVSCNGIVTLDGNNDDKTEVYANHGKIIKKIQSNTFYDEEIRLGLEWNNYEEEYTGLMLLIEALSNNNSCAARVKKIHLESGIFLCTEEQFREAHDPVEDKLFYLPNNLINVEEIIVEHDYSSEYFESTDLPTSIRESVKKIIHNKADEFIRMTLHNMPSLQLLSTRCQTEYTIDIEDCPNLKVASVSNINCFMRDGKISIPQSLEHLDILDYVYTNGSNNPDEQPAPIIMEFPGNLNNLKSLYIDRLYYTEEAQEYPGFEINIPDTLPSLRIVALGYGFINTEIIKIAQNSPITCFNTDEDIYGRFESMPLDIDKYHKYTGTYIKTAIATLDLLFKKPNPQYESNNIIQNIISFLEAVNLETNLLKYDLMLANNFKTLAIDIENNLKKANNNIVSQVLNSKPAQIILSKGRITDYAELTTTTSTSEPPRKRMRLNN